jgi:HSP20 family molecular chaperone IbpA
MHRFERTMRKTKNRRTIGLEQRRWLMLNVTRWEPFREFEKLPDQMARLFGFPTIRPYAMEEALTVADFMPPVDIYETEKEYLIKLDLPEVGKEEVKVFVEDGVLTIQGERRRARSSIGSNARMGRSCVPSRSRRTPMTPRSTPSSRKGC